MQPDTIIPNPLNPQTLNRFLYVGNNPIRYTDPTGHSMEVPDDGGICNPFVQKCGGSITDDITISSGGISLISITGSNNSFLGAGYQPNDVPKIANDTLQPLLPCGVVNISTYCFNNPGLMYASLFGLGPDYWTLNVSIPLIPLMPVFGFDGQLTVDSYGQWYIAGGGYVGLPGTGGSLFGGEMMQDRRPTAEELENFLTKDSVSFAGSPGGLGAGVTWGNFAVGDDGLTWNDFAVEGGLSSPGAQFTWTYGAKLKDLVNDIVSIFTGH